MNVYICSKNLIWACEAERDSKFFSPTQGVKNVCLLLKFLETDILKCKTIDAAYTVKTKSLTTSHLDKL